ncbi:cellulose biosynthesis protein BcsR [Pseudomonas citronellolis]|uniref:cellulose biosynthesis protein BcsR n=1 Tax=Pseudomonas citronellolis TaxID=53408 RepID=UPI0023E469E5|nr:cellulose biosynthesis protein BcsR [Pseudomonas citronellolis]MDF3931316.1 cellulose biosynthesis protein BcsR [Pseudomonas citronellolis]
MEPDDRQRRSDDIAQLKTRLGDEGLHYHDISRESELHAICRRWPLLAETEGVAGPHGPGQAQADRQAQRV